MPPRREIPIVDDESIVAVHHEPDDNGASDDGEATDGSQDRSDTWIVFCHGFLSDKSGSYEGRCRRAAAEGYHGVRFDFRGCGESDGAFVDQTLSDKVADLRTVVDEFDPGRLVLFGSSFGGKVAFHAAPDLAASGDAGGEPNDDPDLQAIATRAPVTYNRTFAALGEEVEREGVVTLEDGRSVDERFVADLEFYPFDDVVGRLDCPIMLVHGTADESVAIADSLEAAAALETDVLLEKVQGEGHRFSRAGERRLRTRLFDWLASLDGE